MGASAANRGSSSGSGREVVLRRRCRWLHALLLYIMKSKGVVLHYINIDMNLMIARKAKCILKSPELFVDGKVQLM